MYTDNLDDVLDSTSSIRKTKSEICSNDIKRKKIHKRKESGGHSKDVETLDLSSPKDLQTNHLSPFTTDELLPSFPNKTREDLYPLPLWLVIASDGFWDVIPPDVCSCLIPTLIKAFIFIYYYYYY
jgi:hypothetical protein